MENGDNAGRWWDRQKRLILFGAAIFSCPLYASPSSIQYEFNSVPPVHAPASDTFYDYRYDANGNLERITAINTGNQTEYAYTTFNKLKQVKRNRQPMAGYLYDIHGKRIAKTDGQGGVVETYLRGIEKTQSGVTSYYFLGGKRLAKQIVGGSLQFFHQDHLGSTSVMTNMSGTPVHEKKYYTFGAIKSEASNGGDDDHAYNDKRRDKHTDMYDYDARSYAAKSFRFVQPDSIVPHSTDPQSWNRYAYVKNNPLKYIDPTGHSGVESESMRKTDYVSEPFVRSYVNYLSSYKRGNELIEQNREWQGCGVIVGGVFSNTAMVALHTLRVPSRELEWDLMQVGYSEDEAQGIVWGTERVVLAGAMAGSSRGGSGVARSGGFSQAYQTSVAKLSKKIARLFGKPSETGLTRSRNMAVQDSMRRVLLPNRLLRGVTEADDVALREAVNVMRSESNEAVYGFVLYGSRARGTATKAASDYDLLVFATPKVRTAFGTANYQGRIKSIVSDALRKAGVRNPDVQVKLRVSGRFEPISPRPEWRVYWTESAQ